MRERRRGLALMVALMLCLALSACGDTAQGDTQPGSVLEPVTDTTSLDGMWSIGGTTKLYFDSESGYYIYRSYWGSGGRGEFFLSEAGGKPMIKFNRFLYDFLLRDDGVLLPCQNGDGDGLAIHRNTFRRDDKAEITEWEVRNWDGVWQNALGETIVIDSESMKYAAWSPDYSKSGTINDAGEGMGLYLHDIDRCAYLCPSEDGNSFTISGEYPGRYRNDQQFNGVFYRDGDIEAYTDLENAEFYYDSDSAVRVWYYDGVNTYYLGDEYTIGNDGLAYHDDDGLVYPAGWIPEEPYDPAADWGDDWMTVGTAE